MSGREAAYEAAREHLSAMYDAALSEAAEARVDMDAAAARLRRAYVEAGVPMPADLSAPADDDTPLLDGAP